MNELDVLYARLSELSKQREQLMEEARLIKDQIVELERLQELKNKFPNGVSYTDLKAMQDLGLLPKNVKLDITVDLDVISNAPAQSDVST